MKDLHEFLDERLAKHQEEKRKLRQLTQSVARTLLCSRDDKHWEWPYSCFVNEDKLVPQYKPIAQVKESTLKKDAAPTEERARSGPSISTQAMICASIDRILLRSRNHEILSDQEKNDLQEAQHKVETEVLKLLEERKDDPLFLYSSTFGRDDIFTASWLFQMYSDQNAWDKKNNVWTDNIKERLVNIVATRIMNGNVVDYERGLFYFGEDRPNEAGPHSLPLLKVIQALEIIRTDSTLAKHWPDDPSLKNAIEMAGDWLEKNLHRQMSFYRFKDFRFDAAELIFCLRGSIMTRRITAYESIVDNVLDAVRDAQQHSVYWRPYRPMTSSSQGGVLLPLSIEVAMALLKTLWDTGKFIKYQDTLEDYSKWLFSQRQIPSNAEEERASEWVGWHSENAYEFKVIHVWDTALVGSFLCDRLDAIDVNFQEEVLRAGSFTYDKAVEIDPDIPALSDHGMITPDAGLSENNTKSRLLSDFVPKGEKRPEKFSVLIYGPPGSSKTTLAQSLAKALNWPLVYLSPSDFIRSGEAGIERQAKDIFDALGILRNKVIFFDEIDRLILDRDSGAYGEQGDMFQFMTPSMLTKISGLRHAKRCIFMIATNYEERIDGAIKRKGRIDELIPWLPMDLTSRTSLFQKFIDDDWKPQATALWEEALTGKLREFAKKCALRVYPELRLCFKNARKKITTKPGALEEWRAQCVDHLISLSEAEIPSSDVKLQPYEKRTTKGSGGEVNYDQRPYLEYAYLLILQGESQSNEQPKKTFKKLLMRWHDQDPEDFEKKKPELENRVSAYGLDSWMK
jgi:hypothetical protein